MSNFTLMVKLTANNLSDFILSLPCDALSANAACNVVIYVGLLQKELHG